MSSMRPDRAGTAAWWTTRVLLPVALLLVASAGIGRSGLDRASLASLLDQASGAALLGSTWFFEGVLHVGGRALVVLVTACLVAWAAAGWRSPRTRVAARRAAYLATSLLVTVAVAGIWERFEIDAQDAYAASGFAWISLYFVGATLNTRHRWLWMVPGLLLGGLFALGQHVRGARQLSDEPLAIALAWLVASVVAALFRRAGWLDWTEQPRPDADSSTLDSFSEPSLPWLASSSLALLGVAFYAIDEVSAALESRIHEFHEGIEVVELLGTSLGVGVTAWLLVERIAAMRARSLRMLQEERERRLRILGGLAASVAHEVRNPLHTLRLIVDEQRREIPALDAHALRRDLDLNLERIDRAVELVYRLARPESGESGSGDLTEATRESVAGLERAAPGRNRFAWGACPDRAPVAASRFDVRLVVDNLLRNATDASPQDRPVSLDLRAVEGAWELQIVNEGSLTPRPRTPEAPGGLGLGLAISRQIIEHAQGSLSVVQENGFVRSTVRLPVPREVPLAE